jgi:hypothetical protein
MVSESGYVCDPALLDAIEGMRRTGVAADIEYDFSGSDVTTPTPVSLRVSFLPSCDLMANACGCPDSQGGLYQVGQFLEVCANTVVCYRIERMVDGELCKLPQDLGNILCVSSLHRAQILRKCSEMYYQSVANT